ncbi:uncharacterized protein LOC128797207 [Vidua chalybeata]|uniref:uncharacterized protein LOC128797207 n=1 Tax=Vidua chalybeata TaxID=81927 RepID=UPI0023A86470|nr:uncharacterized protein LOC128797207 [Vidua chalybeata]XP_053815557.1 uncharacterized protein LOC128797207 [Vidua chalybeata]
MRLEGEKGMDALESTAAAEKMVIPTARSTRVGGRSRGERTRLFPIPSGIMPEYSNYYQMGIDNLPKGTDSTTPGRQKGQQAKKGMVGNYELSAKPRLHPPWQVIVIVILIILLPEGYSQFSHQPFKWILTRVDGKEIQTRISSGSPSFTSSLCTLAPIEPCLNKIGFYMCPASNPGKGYCNYPGEYFCGYWGCETIASDWSVEGDQWLTVSWGPHGCKAPQKDWSDGNQGNCQFVYLNVTKPSDPGWTVGRTWGFRYVEPAKDRGNMFTIKKEPIPPDTRPVGPNPVIGKDGEPSYVEIISNQSNSGIENSTVDNQTIVTPSEDSRFNTL